MLFDSITFILMISFLIYAFFYFIYSPCVLFSFVSLFLMMDVFIIYVFYYSKDCEEVQFEVKKTTAFGKNFAAYSEKKVKFYACFYYNNNIKS